MQKEINEIKKGDFVAYKKRICLVNSTNEEKDEAIILFIDVSELGDDVYVFKKKVKLSMIASISDSFINQNGYLNYIKSLIMSGEDIMCFAA